MIHHLQCLQIIKNLDAKIAEIEAEEKKLAEEEKNEQENKIDNTTKVNEEKINDADIISNKPIQEVLPQFENINPIIESKDFTKEDNTSNVSEIVDKINTTTENTINNLNQPHEETIYKEVSDDEFFDDFFDD